MSTILLPELAREMADSNRRAADSLDAESRRLENLRHELADAAGLHKRATQSAREALTFTLSRKDVAQSIWRHALEAFENGLADEQAREMVADVGGIIETWLRLARCSREMWKFSTMVGGTSGGLEELNTAEKAILQLKVTVEKMQSFFARQRQPIDLARLQQGKQELADARFKSPEELRSVLNG